MGFALNTRIEVTTFGAAIQMVEAGLGIAVMPAGVIATHGPSARVRGVALTDAWAHRELTICIRDPQKLTASARLLLEHLRSAAPRAR